MLYRLADNIISPLGETTAENYQAVKAGHSALQQHCQKWGTEGTATISLFSDALRIKFPFEPTPVVARLHIIILIIDGTHDVYSREPPLVVLIIPHGSHFAIIEKAY